MTLKFICYIPACSPDFSTRLCAIMDMMQVLDCLDEYEKELASPNPPATATASPGQVDTTSQQNIFPDKQLSKDSSEQEAKYDHPVMKVEKGEPVAAAASFSEDAPFDPLALGPLPGAQPHLHKLKVFISDTDAYGMVYAGNYIKFAQWARSELFGTQQVWFSFCPF